MHDNLQIVFNVTPVSVDTEIGVVFTPRCVEFSYSDSTDPNVRT